MQNRLRLHTSLASHARPIVVPLQAPPLPATLADVLSTHRVIGERPGRNGGPRLEVEEVTDEAGLLLFLLCHDYGHGGGGWSTGIGTVLHVVDELLLTRQGITDNLDTPVLVVGAGLIGLYTAVTLLERGFRRITILASKEDGIASTMAGGLWGPVKMNVPDNSRLRQVMDRAEAVTFAFFYDLAVNNLPGARVLPTFFDRVDAHGLDRNRTVVSEDVVGDWGNGVQRELRRYLHNPFMDGPVLLRHWGAELRRRGVEIIQTDPERPLPPYKDPTFLMTVSSYGVEPPHIVMNCAGFGARYLCDDQAVHRLIGHLILLDGRCEPHNNYVLSDYVSDDPAAAVYFHPKQHSYGCWMVGGTFIRRRETDDGDRAPPVNDATGLPIDHEAAFQGVLTRAHLYVERPKR